MTVYVVEFHNYGDDGTVGVYTTEEQAHSVVAKWTKKFGATYHYNIVTVILDKETE